MEIVDRSSELWSYLTEELKGLIEDGELLFDHASKVHNHVSDYSYLVFPFSKCYEGFLKRLFLDLDLIREDEYYGDEIRIGRILNPRFIDDHGNVFSSLCSASGERGKAVATRLWKIWKRGRNQVFHYWPHNYRKLDLNEAQEIVTELVSAMNETVQSCKL